MTSNLYPPFAKLVEQLLAEAKAAGMNVAVFEGLRSIERQKELYAKGRDASGNVVDPKAIVTKAPPYKSFHNYGLAVDVVFDGNDVKPGWQWSWDQKHPWKKLAELGQKIGLEAAYFWTKFPEAPHFQKTYGQTTAQLRLWYDVGGLTKVWAELDKLKP